MYEIQRAGVNTINRGGGLKVFYVSVQSAGI